MSLRQPAQPRRGSEEQAADRYHAIPPGHRRCADHQKQRDPLEGHQQAEIRQPVDPLGGIPLAQIPNPFQQFVHLTIPLLKPTILLTAIMSTSGTLQLFDESVNLTAGGPGKATMTLTHYIYNISFVETPKFTYAAALSVFILVVVAVLSAIQMKVGD